MVSSLNAIAPRIRGSVVTAAAVVLAVALSAGLVVTATPASAAPIAKPKPKPTATAPDFAAGKTKHACATTSEPTCGALLRTDIKPLAAAPNATPYGLNPTNLQTAYSLPSATAGGGQTVAVIDAYDNPNAEADLQVYRNQYLMPTCTTANGCFRKVNQNGASSPLPPLDNGQWAIEMALDVDMVSATCPNCHIILVEANSSATADLFTGIDSAVALGAKFVSLSFADNETKEPLSDVHLNHPGVVITAGTGDTGYWAGPQYPATSPYVVAVGGTVLSAANNARGWSETAWASIFFGTGSGCSTLEPKPATQVGLTPCTGRAVADVSAVAANLAIYDTYQQSGWNVVGGTSASTPVIASVYALAGTRPATDNGTTSPYANKSLLNDVTTGGNGTCGGSSICTAGVGWDGPTGLGTPNGIGAFKYGTTTPPPPGNTVSVTSPGAQSTVVGGAVSLPIRATDSVTSTLTYRSVNLPAGLSISSSTGLISGTPTVAGSSSVTVTVTDTAGASGSATFTWTVTAAASHVVSVTNPGNQSTAVGAAVSVQIRATDSVASTLTYRVSGLPAGLSINSSTGLISGTPTVAGAFTVTVTATDSTGAFGTATFTWTVTAVKHVITMTNPGNQASVVGTAVSLQLHATDSVASTLSYQAVGLPAGLSINSATGLVSGTPTTTGTSSVVFTVTDPAGATAAVQITWTVGAGTAHVVVVTNPGNQSTVRNTGVSLQIHATDSATSTLSYQQRGLPTGLSINASTGLISGTPTVAGQFPVTIFALDATGAVATATFTWTIQ